MTPTVAIVGASQDRSKFGNKSVRAHLKAGFQVYPVHPRAQEIEGLPVYADLEALPGPVDDLDVCAPARRHPAT